MGGPDVLDLDEIDLTQVALAGGKGARLGECARIGGLKVPAGFCVTTEAFRGVVASEPSIESRLDRLSGLRPDDREAIRTLSAEIRAAIAGSAIPDQLASAIARRLSRGGEGACYAVRSSATAEDSPTASFAGQQDSYLNVVGVPSVLEHLGRCWASLFSERAVSYRLRNGLEQAKAQMAVVVQQMVFADASGVAFTADPVTSNRKLASIEASFGLGEALASGRVNADVYTVRDGVVVEKTVAVKTVAVHPSPGGGTRKVPIEPERQQRPVLTDSQVLRLARLGRRIEAHFGEPQDIEWCLVGDELFIVQSRPITTLFPIPPAADRENHVYVSVGHQQMMTDAMKPLGLSMWRLIASRPMCEAGGRLFVDVTKELGAPATRAWIMTVLRRSDPLMGDALQALLERRDFVPAPPDDNREGQPAGGPTEPLETDPAIVAGLIERSESSLANLTREIVSRSGQALLEFILGDLEELKRVLTDPPSLQVIISAMEAAWWLDEQLQARLGEKGAVDALTQSVPHNVTSEMGLALLDVADAIRPHPDVVAFLEHVQRVQDADFLEELPRLAGGLEARAAIAAYLERYGMRCVGEIDITRPRWSERPDVLVPMILANVKNFEPGEAGRRFEQGLARARSAEEELLARLAALPGGEQKAEEAKRMIDRVRTFMGYREYPKYHMISRFFVYKRALSNEAERLVRAGVLDEGEDIFFLALKELRDVLRSGHVDRQLIAERKQAFRSYGRLTPPRVLTSDGEVIAGSYRRDDVPAGALVGLAVSAGTVEGRARVVLDIADADLQAGDILVTSYADPSWTPVFVAVKGLVTEVGGLMTHGAVIAREYGLPAVVGVEHATRRIGDGQRIRVNGTDGYVEILPA